MKDYNTIKDTTGFSRVVVQLRPNKISIAATDTTDFSRVVVQLWPFGIATI
jgi:hypothetical protein